MHKCVRKIVEERSIGWFFALFTKVTWCSNDSLAKQVHPNPVDVDTGCQGIVDIGDGLCQIKASGGILPFWALLACDALQKLPWGWLSRNTRVTAFVNIDRSGGCFVRHCHREFRGCWRGLLHGCYLRKQSLVIGRFFRLEGLHHCLETVWRWKVIESCQLESFLHLRQKLVGAGNDHAA